MAKDVDAMAAAVSNLTDATASLTSLPTCDANLNTAPWPAAITSTGILSWPRRPVPRLIHIGCVVGDPVCANVPAADTAVTIGVTDLLAAVDDIKADVLNCTKFQPIIETAFHDGVCTEAVAGLYYIWQVVAAAAVFTYVGIWLVPFATAAFKQEGGGVVGVADTDPREGHLRGPERVRRDGQAHGGGRRRGPARGRRAGPLVHARSCCPGMRAHRGHPRPGPQRTGVLARAGSRRRRPFSAVLPPACASGGASGPMQARLGIASPRRLRLPSCVEHRGRRRGPNDLV